MTMHFLQHVSFEGPGYIEQWCQKNNLPTSFTRFYEPSFSLPGMDGFDALVILGGPMSVYDDLEYPWLEAEKDFIRTAIQKGKKVLGICLGAQLAAFCLGAKVIPARHREIGWYPVFLTEACMDISWLYNLFLKSPDVFHWHGEQFTLPEGSIDLLYSRANHNQAFLYQNQVMGLQFHLEVTPEAVTGLVDNCSSELELSKYIQDRYDILKGVALCAKVNLIANNVLKRFLLP